MALAADDTSQDSVLTFDWTAAESVSAAVVDAVAATSGEAPTAIDPLYTVIEPDALDSMFDSRDGEPDSPGLFVEFPYDGVLV